MEIYQYNQEVSQSTTPTTAAAEFSKSPPVLLQDQTQTCRGVFTLSALGK